MCIAPPPPPPTYMAKYVWKKSKWVNISPAFKDIYVDEIYLFTLTQRQRQTVYFFFIHCNKFESRRRRRTEKKKIKK